MLGIFTEHPDNTLSPDDLAFVTHFLDRRANFHNIPFFSLLRDRFLLCPVGDPAPGQVVR